MALFLGPRIPFAYACILSVLLSAVDFFFTGNIAAIMVGGYFLLKNRKHLTFSVPSFSISSLYISTSATTRKQSLIFVFFLVFWLMRGVAFTFADSWEDKTRFGRNLVFIMREVPAIIDEFTMPPGVFSDDEAQERLREEEVQLIKTEDPDGVRILRNRFEYYTLAEDFGRMDEIAEVKMTIDLGVTPNRINPGRRVRFKATPSWETPSLGSSVMLVANPLGYTTTLRRTWFRSKYQGSIKFEPKDTGKYTFGIVTKPRYDRKIKKMMVYISNPVSVVIAPDSSQLSRILLPDRVHLSVFEGSTQPLTLFGESLGGELYNITEPETGTFWTVEDESKAIVTKEEYNNSTVLKGLAPGQTKVVARHGTFEAQADVIVFSNRPISYETRTNEPPAAERPRTISPPDGFVARVGERLQLEVTSFDVSQGYTFDWSSWRVYKVNPKTDERGAEVAYLRGGNSEKAEWIPGGTGTFELEVTYHYSMGPRAPGEAISFPQRIKVVN